MLKVRGNTWISIAAPLNGKYTQSFSFLLKRTKKLYSVIMTVHLSVSSTFGPTPEYNGEALERIASQMEKEIPLGDGSMAKRRARKGS